MPPEYVSVPPPHRDEQRRLSYESTLKLKQWMARPEHWVFPYPSDHTKRELCELCSMDMTQISNWFRNERKRIWLPLKRKAKKRWDLLSDQEQERLQRLNYGKAAHLASSRRQDNQTTDHVWGRSELSRSKAASASSSSRQAAGAVQPVVPPSATPTQSGTRAPRSTAGSGSGSGRRRRGGRRSISTPSTGTQSEDAGETPPQALGKAGEMGAGAGAREAASTAAGAGAGPAGVSGGSAPSAGVQSSTHGSSELEGGLDM